MSYPVFATGDVLNASDMNAVSGWLVKTQTVGTGVSSVTVTSAFSADYDNYLIVIQGIVNSTAANLTLQLSGITTNTYSTGGTFFTYGSTTVSGFGPAATSSWVIGPAGTVNSHAVISVMAPNAATSKSVFAQGSSTLAYYSFAGTCTSTSTATGFVIAPNAGTMTGGTIRVYGYRN